MDDNNLRKHLEIYYKEQENKCRSRIDRIVSDFDRIPETSKLSPVHALQCIDILDNLAEAAGDIEYDLNLEEVRDYIDNCLNKETLQYCERMLQINDAYQAKCEKVLEDYRLDAEAYNQSLVDAETQRTAIYRDVEKKREELCLYGEKIMEICCSLDITSDELAVELEQYTIEEVAELYDQYIELIQKETASNIFTVLQKKIPHFGILGGILFAGIIATFFNVIMVPVSVASLGYIFYKQCTSAELIKYYVILYGLMFNINPLQYPEAEPRDVSDQFIPTKMTDEEEDNCDALNAVIDEWDKAVEDMGEDPKELLARIQMDYNNSIDEVTDLGNQTQDIVDDAVRDLKEVIQKRRDEIEEYVAKYREEHDYLGQSVSKSCVFDTNFKIGLIDGIEEETVDVGLQNIVIRPYPDKIRMTQFLQCLLANALCNVRINKLGVTVFDPNNMCSDLIQFYSVNIDHLLKLESNSLDPILDRLKEIAAGNLRKLGGLDINTFNIECEKTGKTSIEYELLIVLSQPKKIEEDEALMEFMSYSARVGVFVWIVTDLDIKDTFVFETPFNGIMYPYKIDIASFGISVARTLENAIAADKSDALLWDTFIERAIPDSAIWTYVSDDLIEIDPGFYEGDPTQYKGYTVGNQGDIHMLGVGGTGAGKSVFINNVIANLTRKYSPQNLRLWLIDYKGNEFSFYLKSKEFPHALPHIDACLCTSDGEFAGSLFTAIFTMTKGRFDFLADRLHKNVKTWNVQCRAENRLMDIIPRAVVINDEFQVIFECKNMQIIDTLISTIKLLSKLARAAGVHLFFTSQSMKGTISTDVQAQFTLRFGLRCDEQVSEEVMGSKLSSSIRATNGYLYIRCMADESPMKARKYRTPYISEDRLKAHIIEMEKRVETLTDYVQKKPITYNEAVMHSVDELVEVYQKVKHKLSPYGVFLLGERMTYSQNRLPENIELGKSDNSHMACSFFKEVDLINFTKSLYVNIQQFSREVDLFINSQVKALHYLCEVDIHCDEQFMHRSTNETTIHSNVDFFEMICSMREEEPLADHKPFYAILIGWDKTVGWGVERDPNLALKFSLILKRCGSLDMHFIFVGSTSSKMPINCFEAIPTKILGYTTETLDAVNMYGKDISKSELKENFAYINNAGVINRIKIYQSSNEREIKKNTVVLLDDI